MKRILAAMALIATVFSTDVQAQCVGRRGLGGGYNAAFAGTCGSTLSYGAGLGTCGTAALNYQAQTFAAPVPTTCATTSYQQSFAAPAPCGVQSYQQSFAAPLYQSSYGAAVAAPVYAGSYGAAFAAPFYRQRAFIGAPFLGRPFFRGAFLGAGFRRGFGGFPLAAPFGAGNGFFFRNRNFAFGRF